MACPLRGGPRRERTSSGQVLLVSHLSRLSVGVGSGTVEKNCRVPELGSCLWHFLPHPRSDCLAKAYWLAFNPLSSTQRNLRHYVTVRSKQTFSTGIVALEFIIEQCNSSTWSVGFVDDNFDFDHRRFIDHKREVCYSWCNLVSASHSVTGSPTTFSKSRRLLSGWQQGDVLGALVDFDKREIQYFRNDKWNETVKLRPESTKLWAITTMFNSGNAVRIRLRSLGSRPAEWREQHHHA
ncbi:hypothetical protein QOT17_025344 [Balamuthia mandrillaris]